MSYSRFRNITLCIDPVLFVIPYLLLSLNSLLLILIIILLNNPHFPLVLADVISTVEFNQTGDLLATGDKGGRVVIFQRETEVSSVCQICNNHFILTLPVFFFVLNAYSV